MNDIVTAAEFRDRLLALCARGDGRHFPTRLRDRHILFRAVLLSLDPEREYAEKEFTEALARWLETAGPALTIDAVSLRRELVDAGYATRDAAGSVYRTAESFPAEAPDFDRDIEAVDPAREVRAAREAERRRREAFTGAGKER